MREGVTTVQPIKISYFPPIVDSLVLAIIHLLKVFAKYAECCTRGRRERVSDVMWLPFESESAVCCGSCDITAVVPLLGCHGACGVGH